MRNLTVVICMLAVSAAWAQVDVPRTALPRFDTVLPSHAEVVRMRWSGFWKWSQQHARGMTEVQGDFLARWYVQVREVATRRMLVGDPLAAPLESAAQELASWTDDCVAEMSLASGGGPQWRHLAARSLARLADAKADAIRIGHAQTISWDDVGPLPPAGPHCKVDAATVARAVEEVSLSLARVKKALANLPPASRAVLMHYMVGVTRLRSDASKTRTAVGSPL